MKSAFQLDPADRGVTDRVIVNGGSEVRSRHVIVNSAILEVVDRRFDAAAWPTANRSVDSFAPEAEGRRLEDEPAAADSAITALTETDAVAAVPVGGAGGVAEAVGGIQKGKYIADSLTSVLLWLIPFLALRHVED